MLPQSIIVNAPRGDRALRPQRRLMFFGDSICVGQGVSIHKGWVAQLAAHVAEAVASRGRDVLVINSSINGNTTRQALERMPYDVQSQRVDCLIVQFGLNDCNYWHSDNGVPRVSPKAFGANLEEIMTRAVTFGARRIIVNTNHPTTRTSETLPFASITFQESNSRYNEIIRGVATQYRGPVILNDVARHIDDLVRQGQVANVADLLLDDGLHLNERGHRIYYAAIEPLVVQWLHES